MLLDQFRRLGKHSMIYGLSSALASSATLVLVPLLTRHLSPKQYGTLEILAVFAAQLSVLAQLGLGSALFKFGLRSREGLQATAIVFNTAYWTIASIAVLTTVAMLLCATQIAYMLIGDAQPTLVRWVLVKVLFDAIGIVPMVRLRMKDDSVVYGGLAASRMFVSLVFVFIGLGWFDDALIGVVIAMAAESCLFALLATATAAKELAFRISPVHMREMLGFGLPLVPYAFVLTILALGDRYFLRLFGGLDDVGPYAVGYKLAAILAVPVRAFQVAWPSIMFSMAPTRNGRRFFAKVLTYLLLVLGFFGVIVSVFARDLIQLLAPAAYSNAYVVVPILIFAQIGLGAFYATAVGTNITGKTYLQTVSAVVALLVFGATAVLLVPRFGMVGAACATASGYLALASTDCYFSLRLYPVPYEWPRITLVVVFMIVLIYAGMRIETGTRIVDIPLKLAVAATYPGLLFLLGFFSPSERAAFRGLLYRGSVSSRQTIEAVVPHRP
jgi:O-antigen/teichoic acid export membrane protein